MGLIFGCSSIPEEQSQTGRDLCQGLWSYPRPWKIEYIRKGWEASIYLSCVRVRGESHTDKFFSGHRWHGEGVAGTVTHSVMKSLLLCDVTQENLRKHHDKTYWLILLCVYLHMYRSKFLSIYLVQYVFFFLPSKVAIFFQFLTQTSDICLVVTFWKRISHRRNLDRYMDVHLTDTRMRTRTWTSITWMPGLTIAPT